LRPTAAPEDRRAVLPPHARDRPRRGVPRRPVVTGTETGTGTGTGPSLLRRRMGTLRFRITAVAVVAVIGVLTAVGVALVLAQRATLLSDLDENLAHQADVVATRLRAGEDVGRATLLSDDVAVLVSGPQGDTGAGAPGLIHAIFRYGPEPSRAAVTTVPLAGPDGEA